MRYAAATVPCASCTTMAGKTRDGRPTPLRFAGTRFGVPGKLCLACYQRHANAHRRRLKAAAAVNKGGAS